MKVISLADVVENNPHIIEMLQNCPCQVLKSMEIVSFKANEFLLQQGEYNNYFYIIILGKIEIFYITENGKTIPKVLKQDGDFFGEFELFDQVPLISYAKSLTPIKLIKIKRKYLIKWLELDNNFHMYLTKKLCTTFRLYSDATTENFIYPLRTRLCKYLLSKCKHIPDSTKNVEIKFNKTVMCKKFSVTLRTLNRSLQILHDKNILKTKKNILIINDLVLLLEELNIP